METPPPDSHPETTRPASNTRPAVIRPHRLPNGAQARVLERVLPAWLTSGLVHVLLLTFFLLITLTHTTADPRAERPEIHTEIAEVEGPRDANLENDEIGLDPNVLLNYNLDRIEPVSVPGLVDANAVVGIKDAPEGQMLSVPPPLGLGGNLGQGGGLDGLTPGSGSLAGLVGGFPGGTFVPGGPGGRSGATRQKLLLEGGGNSQSEAAVAAGLKWLVQHQARDGRWSLNAFNRHGRCNCTGFGQDNDVAATALGLLPLLGAGETHKNSKLYSDNVKRGLDYLIAQNKDGYYGSEMYAHGLASIAMCEAHALTGDPKLRASAQRALDFIRSAQSGRGGWRYQPGQDGDTSVVGWQVMALKSGQMAGLTVDEASNPTLTKAARWLDSCMAEDGSGYGYRGSQPTPTMTAVGLLCRQYLGWNPRNPKLAAGVNTLHKTPPGSLNSIYYHYYATQVLYHVGGDGWISWNEKMRDLLIKKQDKGDDPKRAHLKGSWSPAGDAHGGAGGRLMTTSLAILTLEVYYRHLPLYRRDLVGK